MLIGSKNRIAGLALSATDDDWQHGQGDAVEGPLLSLLLAMTGRAGRMRRPRRPRACPRCAAGASRRPLAT